MGLAALDLQLDLMVFSNLNKWLHGFCVMPLPSRNITACFDCPPEAQGVAGKMKNLSLLCIWASSPFFQLLKKMQIMGFQSHGISVRGMSVTSPELCPSWALLRETHTWPKQQQPLLLHIHLVKQISWWGTLWGRTYKKEEGFVYVSLTRKSFEHFSFQGSAGKF